MIAGFAEPGSRVPVRFRLWSGKLAVVQEDLTLCATEIHMHSIAQFLSFQTNLSSGVPSHCLSHILITRANSGATGAV